MRKINTLKRGALSGAALLASLLLVAGCASGVPAPGGNGDVDNNGGSSSDNGNTNGNNDNPTTPVTPSGSTASVQEACIWSAEALDQLDNDFDDFENPEEYARFVKTLPAGYHSVASGIQNSDVRGALTDIAEGWDTLSSILLAAMTGTSGSLPEFDENSMEQFSKGLEKYLTLCSAVIPDIDFDLDSNF